MNGPAPPVPAIPPVLLLDERRAPSLRDFLGPVLAGAAAADFAITRVRLAAVDLEPDELAGLVRCRLLLGRVDAQTLAGTERDAAIRREHARRLHGLRALLAAGAIEVRAAGTAAWSPDFSVVHGGARAAPEPRLALLGAHYFARPFPVGGPALTCVLRDAGVARSFADRFEELWRRGYDIAAVIDDALARMAPGGETPAVREAAALYRAGAGSIAEKAGSERTLKDPGAGPGAARPRAERTAGRGLTPGAQPDAGGGDAAGGAPVAPRDGSDRGKGGAAAAVLRCMLLSRFGPPPSVGGPPGEARPLFDLAAFQHEAVERAATALAAWRGVVIADAVGLGKTYVALALIERAVRAGRRAAVIGPAALRNEWTRPLRRLRDACGCASIGLGGEDGGGAPATGGGLVAWLTHARLSRGSHRPERLLPLDLVVVDEAHAFRSERTRRYHALAELCRDARVVLLTATPVNNAPGDLRALLRLFAADGAFRDAGVPSLAEAFAAGAGGDVGPVPIARVLERVMIRRTRPFVRERHGGVLLPDGRRLAFPRRAPPVAVRYTLDDALPGFAAEAVARIEALAFAPLRLGAYGDDAAEGAGAADLLRVHLLKRLESSAAAFEATLRHQIRFLEAFLDALHRGRLLAPREHAGLHAGDRDAVQLSLDTLVLRRLPPRLEVERLDGDAGADLHALRGLARALAGAPPGTDPKLAALRTLLDGPLAGEKVLVFTEFRDTARHLWRALAERGHVALIDGGGAFLGRSPAGRREVIARFAPRANGRPEPPPRERVDLLIATDVLSEGLNLQDARRVVSYDLPWNPVRLIQRIGRIDRLGSSHETVYTYHFLPEHGLEHALRLLERLRRKIVAIGRTVGGEDSPLAGRGAGAAWARRGGKEEAGGGGVGQLEPGAGASLLDRLAAGDPDVLDDIERADAAPFEAEERLRAAWRALAAGQDHSRAEMHGAPEVAKGTATEPGARAPGGADRDTAAETGQAAGLDVAIPTASMTLEGRHRLLLALAAGEEKRWLVYDVADARIDADPRAADVLAAVALERAPSAGLERMEAAPRPEGGSTDRLPPAGPASDVRPRASRVSWREPVPDRRLLDGATAAAERALRAEPLARRLSPPAHRSPAARAARRAIGLLAALPGGPDAALCARADAALGALERVRDAGTETAIAALLDGKLRGTEAEAAEAFLGGLEAVLPAPPEDGGSVASKALPWQLMAALEVVPPGGRRGPSGGHIRACASG